MASLKAVNQHLVSATEHKQEVGCQLSKRPALIQNWLYLKIWVKYLKMVRTWGPLIGTTYIVIFYFLFFASKIFFSFFWQELILLFITQSLTKNLFGLKESYLFSKEINLLLTISYVQVRDLIPVFVQKTKKRASDIGLLALCVLVHFIVMRI